MQQSDGFLPTPSPLKKLVWEAPDRMPFTSMNPVYDYASPLFWLLELCSGIHA